MRKSKGFEPHERLSEGAKDIWRYVVASLPANALKESDRLGLAELCMLSEIMFQHGLTGRGLQAREFGLLVTLTAHFGLTPKSRLALEARRWKKKKTPNLDPRNL